MKPLDQYKAVIFDLDGTLYYQKPLRRDMLVFLIKHLLTHPTTLNDILIIKKYRSVREKWDTQNFSLNMQDDSEEFNLEMSQYQAVANIMGVSARRVEEAVNFYMIKTPLELVARHKDTRLLALIEVLRQKGIKIIVFSDYPVKEKLEAMGLIPDASYCSFDEKIGAMKPDPKGLRIIMSEHGLEAKETIMIGDRLEKDGECAKGCGMDYLILSRSFDERQKQLEMLETGLEIKAYD